MTLKDEITKNPEGMRVWMQEHAILETTELICGLMQERNMSRAELASRIGRTKQYVGRLLNGTTTMPIRVLSDIFLALDRGLKPTATAIER